MARSYENIRIDGKAHLGDSYYLAQDHRLADLVPFAVQAPFNASGKDNDSHCLQGTRIHILKRIQNWLHDEDDNGMFWLSGLAGTGKSTIARTVAREIYESPTEYWMASFFFKRGGGDSGHAKQFVGTIATQLANKNTSFRGLLKKAVSDDQGIVDRVMRDQWQELILSPISQLKNESRQARLIIVIDALNECDKRDDIIQILGLLVTFCKFKQLRPRILITSTPETYIQEAMLELTKSERPCITLHDEPRDIVNHDILLFLEAELSNIRSLHMGKDEFNQLLQKAAGLFIWADTACRFIAGAKGVFKKNRLNAILEDSNSSNRRKGHPESHLDELYLTVLHEAIKSYTDDELQELYCLLRQILGSIVILLAPLSLHSLLRLLGDLEDVNIIHEHLEDLCSILDFPKDEAKVLCLHHPSFRDFLLSKERCQDENFWIDEQNMHHAMTKHCIDLMSTLLREDICGAKSPGVRVIDIEEAHKERCLPPELRYACLCWVQHLQCSNKEVEDNDFIYDFLQVHLLHWLEALSIIGKASESLHIIRNLQSLLRTNRSSILAAFLDDAIRLVTANTWLIRVMPLQIYTSALAFTPQESPIRERYGLPHWLSFGSHTYAHHASLDLTSPEEHCQDINLVHSITFSHNQELITSASSDLMIRIWRVDSGECMQELKGHVNRINSVVFSHDLRLIASASLDKTVRVWRVDAGKCMQELKGHTNGVNSVAFSRDSALIASTSDDTVWIWRADIGERVQVLKGHTRSVNAVVFSGEPKLIASASSDHTVRIWRVETGECMQELKGHTNGAYSVAFSHDSSLIASASDSTVWIWCTETWTCIQKTELDTFYPNLEFEPEGTMLLTGVGAIPLTVRPISNVQMDFPQQSRVSSPTSSARRGLDSRHSYGISQDTCWITHNGKDLVWIPPTFRTGSTAISGPYVAIGSMSGKVKVLRFLIHKSPVL